MGRRRAGPSRAAAVSTLPGGPAPAEPLTSGAHWSAFPYLLPSTRSGRSEPESEMRRAAPHPPRLALLTRQDEERIGSTTSLTAAPVVLGSRVLRDHAGYRREESGRERTGEMAPRRDSAFTRAPPPQTLEPSYKALRAATPNPSRHLGSIPFPLPPRDKERGSRKRSRSRRRRAGHRRRRSTS